MQVVDGFWTTDDVGSILGEVYKSIVSGTSIKSTSPPRINNLLCQNLNLLASSECNQLSINGKTQLQQVTTSTVSIEPDQFMDMD